MASSGRPVFPERLRAVLDLRSSKIYCPADVAERIQSIPYFKPRGPKPAASRFGHLMTNDTGRSDWSPAAGAGRQSHDDGFVEVWSGRRRGGGGRGGGGGGMRASRPTSDGFHMPSRKPAGPTSSSTPVPRIPKPVVSDVPETPAFSSSAIKNSIDVEDRLLARVKGKINKIGPSTYDATKVFMQQILDSDETDFLDELMGFIFQKAATESAFCPLYARLLHELADEFAHLRTVMQKLFRDYMAIFQEVETSPDVGTADYKVWLEAQERKKFRRGYSQFVAELVKQGEASADDLHRLIQQIVSVLEVSHIAPAKTLVCEEYIDCLANMCNSACAILSRAEWSANVRERLEVLTKKPRSETPGLTNKGRFALMDLVDFAKRGWKPMGA